MVTDGAGLAGEHVPLEPTLTVAWAVVVPPGPVAVSVYVVVAEGETVTVPEVGCDPMPLSIVTEVALLVDHDRVDDCPAEIEVGFAEKLMVGAGVEVVTFIFTDAFAGTLPLLSQYWTTT